MIYDIYTICIIILAVLIIAAAFYPMVSKYFRHISGAKKESGNPPLGENRSHQDEVTFPMVSVGDGKKAENYSPDEDELDLIEECVSGSEESSVLDSGMDSDYSILLSGNAPRQKLRDSIVSLMHSRMQFTDLNGNLLSLDDVLSDAGSAEEVAGVNDSRYVDPEPPRQREARIDEAIRRLENNKI